MKSNDCLHIEALLCHTSFTHKFVIHFFSTHAIFHTQLLPHAFFHTHLPDIFFVTSITNKYVTSHFSHTTLPHTIFHTQLCHTQLWHTQHLCQTPSFTYASSSRGRCCHTPSFPYLSHATCSYNVFHAQPWHTPSLSERTVSHIVLSHASSAH